MRRQKGSEPLLRQAGLCLLCVALCVLLAGPSLLQAQENEEPSKKETRITADKVVYSRQESSVLFKGHVHASRETFELWCDAMTVYVAKKAAAGGDAGRSSLQGRQNVERIVAEGDVRLEMDGRSAKSRKAVYESSPEILTLIGDVHLREKQNTIEGQKVKLYLKEDRSEIMSGEEGQVEAVFYSSEGDESQ